jgi:hypothetical protein
MAYLTEEEKRKKLAGQAAPEVTPDLGRRIEQAIHAKFGAPTEGLINTESFAAPFRGFGDKAADPAQRVLYIQEQPYRQANPFTNADSMWQSYQRYQSGKAPQDAGAGQAMPAGRWMEDTRPETPLGPNPNNPGVFPGPDTPRPVTAPKPLPGPYDPSGMGTPRPTLQQTAAQVSGLSDRIQKILGAAAASAAPIQTGLPVQNFIQTMRTPDGGTMKVSINSPDAMKAEQERTQAKVQQEQTLAALPPLPRPPWMEEAINALQPRQAESAAQNSPSAIVNPTTRQPIMEIRGSRVSYSGQPDPGRVDYPIWSNHMTGAQYQNAVENARQQATQRTLQGMQNEGAMAREILSGENALAREKAVIAGRLEERKLANEGAEKTARIMAETKGADKYDVRMRQTLEGDEEPVFFNERTGEQKVDPEVQVSRAAAAIAKSKSPQEMMQLFQQYPEAQQKSIFARLPKEQRDAILSIYRSTK